MECPSCSSNLKEPYINCVECQPNVQICLRCFAKGVEFEQHSNDHSYEIKTLSFSLFDDDKWSARDEITLLDQLEDCGFGNWAGLSKRLYKKTPKDIEDHYMKNYIKNAKQPLPKVTVECEQILRRPINFEESSMPPRPGVNSSADDELFMIGYMPARGDFVVEPDNFAELDVKDVEFFPPFEEPDELITEMNHQIVDMYYIRQRERNAKKNLVKRYGLLDVSTANVFYTFGRQERAVRDLLRKFAQLMKPNAHEKLIQSIIYQKELESRIQSLQEYRNYGLRYMKDALFYEKQKRRRMRTKKTRTYKLDEVVMHGENALGCQVWLQRQLSKKKTHPLPIPALPARKVAQPLNISGLPGCDNLTEDEKELCSNVRITPNDYLGCRTILQEESFRSNGVKLQTARSLLKIDVNRTKKLYDFLINKGQIKNISQSSA